MGGVNWWQGSHAALDSVLVAPRVAVGEVL